MIRQPTLPAAESDGDDRSMRHIEYVLAFIAVLAAGVLAFAR